MLKRSWPRRSSASVSGGGGCDQLLVSRDGSGRRHQRIGELGPERHRKAAQLRLIGEAVAACQRDREPDRGDER